MAQTQTNDEMEFDDLDAGDTYDKAEAAKSGDFGEPVPDGKYQCIIDKAWLAYSKKDGKRMLRWQLKIIGSAHSGRVLFHNNMIETTENVKWLKGDLTVCGLTIQKLAELKDKVSSLVGVGLEVQVKNLGKDAQGRQNQNTYFNKTIEIDRSAAAATPAPGGSSGGSNGGFTDDEVPF